MSETILHYFVYDHPADPMPKPYGMFTVEGDRAVATAVGRFVHRAKEAARQDGILSPADRYRVVQSPDVLSNRGHPYDTYLGHSDELPPDVALDEARFHEGSYEAPFAAFEYDPISAWIRVPLGVLLFLFILLCSTGVVAIFWIGSDEGDPMLLYGLGLVLGLLCLWMLVKSGQMVIGHTSKGGLFGPTTLRIIAFLFLIMPFAGIFTGYYAEKGIAGTLRAVIYLILFFALMGLARARTRG